MSSFCCIVYIRRSKVSHLVNKMSVGMESCNPPMPVQRVERKKYLLSSLGWRYICWSELGLCCFSCVVANLAAEWLTKFQCWHDQVMREGSVYRTSGHASESVSRDRANRVEKNCSLCGQGWAQEEEAIVWVSHCLLSVFRSQVPWSLYALRFPPVPIDALGLWLLPVGCILASLVEASHFLAWVTLLACRMELFVSVVLQAIPWSPNTHHS